MLVQRWIQKVENTRKSGEGNRRQKSKRVAQLGGINMEGLCVEESDAEEWLDFDSWSSDIVQCPSSFPLPTITLVTPIQPGPATACLKHSTTSVRYHVPSPISSTIRVT